MTKNEAVQDDYLEPGDEELSQPTGRDYPERPRAVVNTTIVTMGVPGLGSDGVLDIWGKGFDPEAGTPTVLLDGEPLPYEGSEMRSDDTFSTRLTAPPDLPNGDTPHRSPARCRSGGPVHDRYLREGQTDDHLDEPTESRFVPQPLEPDEDDGHGTGPYGESSE